MSCTVVTPVGEVSVDKQVAQFFKSKGSEVRKDA
jgi:hypothetical protein